MRWSRDVHRPPRRTVSLRSSAEVAADPAAVFAFHADPTNLLEVTPSTVPLELVSAPRLAVGARIELAVRWVGLRVPWVAEVVELTEPHGFRDVQRRGPFRWFDHRHQFLARAGGGTCVVDEVRFALFPFEWLDRRLVLPRLQHMFEERRRALVTALGEPDAGSTPATSVRPGADAGRRSPVAQPG